MSNAKKPERPPTDISRSTGARVAEIRKARGMSQAKLGELAGAHIPPDVRRGRGAELSDGYISHLEAGHRWPSEYIWQALAEALGVHWSAFFVVERDAAAEEAARLLAAMESPTRDIILAILRALAGGDLSRRSQALAALRGALGAVGITFR